LVKKVFSQRHGCLAGSLQAFNLLPQTPVFVLDIINSAGVIRYSIKSFHLLVMLKSIFLVLATLGAFVPIAVDLLAMCAVRHKHL
jgi:hypothetical protein